MWGGGVQRRRASWTRHSSPRRGSCSRCWTRSKRSRVPLYVPPSLRLSLQHVPLFAHASLLLLPLTHHNPACFVSSARQWSQGKVRFAQSSGGGAREGTRAGLGSVVAAHRFSSRGDFGPRPGAAAGQLLPPPGGIYVGTPHFYPPQPYPCA